MSNNLLKRNFTWKEESCLIKGDELARKRIEELAARTAKTESDGFSSGLSAASVEIQTEAEGEGGLPGNVIKAKPAEEAMNLVEQAKKEAAGILEEAGETARRIKDEAAAQAEQEKQLVLEQARAQGREEGLKQLAERSALLEKEWQEKCRLTEEDYRNRLEEMEPQLVETIAGIYEHIFHVELGNYRELLPWLISSAMRNIEGSRSFFIHVSGEDYAYVSGRREQLAADASAGNITVEVIEDIALAKNDCLIETECGIFDCGLDTELSELHQKLKLLSYEKQQ